MKIELIFTHDDEVVMHADCNSVESAVQECYRFERHVLPKLDITKCDECGDFDAVKHLVGDESRNICELCYDNATQ